jgi:hypothetical protein
MGVIHQTYITHCTYGSSAVARRSSGDGRDEVLGYSARASSFSQHDLMRHTRTLERLVAYSLPRDTPPDKKRTLTAQCAPHRMFFHPNASGLQVLGFVSYRQQDRYGRLGAYFGHALIAQVDPGTPPWDVLECLQLWNV